MDGTSSPNVFELERTDDGQFYQAVRHAIVSVEIIQYIQYHGFPNDSHDICLSDGDAGIGSAVHGFIRYRVQNQEAPRNQRVKGRYSYSEKHVFSQKFPISCT